MFGISRHRGEQHPSVDYASLVSVLRQSAARPRPTPRMQAKLAALTVVVPHVLNNPLTALTAAPHSGAQPQEQPQMQPQASSPFPATSSNMVPAAQ